jgi:5-methylcytosine-specific restriction endonuclease McrA
VKDKTVESWKEKRTRILAERRCCGLCGGTFFTPKGKRNRRRSALHHRTYKNVGNENDIELTLLCYRCHQLITAIHKMVGVGWTVEKLKWTVQHFFLED